MKNNNKHLHLARRKMGHIIDEIYTALLHYGSHDVSFHLKREAEGLRLQVVSDFAGEHLSHVRRMGELLCPVVRNPAMVEMYWELAGEDGYTSDSEMSLVGQMASDASLSIEGQSVRINLFVEY